MRLFLASEIHIAHIYIATCDTDCKLSLMIIMKMMSSACRNNTMEMRAWTQNFFTFFFVEFLFGYFMIKLFIDISHVNWGWCMMWTFKIFSQSAEAQIKGLCASYEIELWLLSRIFLAKFFFLGNLQTQRKCNLEGKRDGAK